MRTTLTLDPDVAARVKSETRRTGKSFKAVVNEALKRGLGLSGRPPRAPRFEVEPHAFGFKPGVDLDRVNQLADELEAAETGTKAARVIVPDVNLLVHAYNRESPRHAAARAWWEARLNGSSPVGLPWVALLGFIRITTSRQVLDSPLPVARACQHVRAWLDRPCASIVHPGDRHAAILFGLFDAIGTAANLTTDAHLAALAIAHQAELQSTDTDFARFPGLRWRNPIG